MSQFVHEHISPPLAPGLYPPSALDGRLLFKRASPATYLSAAGYLVIAGDNVPRYDPAGDLLIEEQATNLVVNSETSTIWFNNEPNTPIPESLAGCNGTKLIFQSVSGNYPSVRAAVPIAAGATVCASLYVDLATIFSATRQFRLLVIDEDGTNRVEMVIRRDGTILLPAYVLSGDNVSNPAGGISQLSGSVYRVWVSGKFSKTSTTGNNVRFHVLGANGDSTVCGCPQIELGPVPTSYIPTPSYPGTRAADVARTYTIDAGLTIISQYANSPTLLQLIANMEQNIDPRTNFDDFYDFVWNVDTAQGFGLDIWGRIVGVGRDVKVASAVRNFGYQEGLSYQPFGQAPFFSGTPASEIYTLTDEAYRTLILVKALANISNCTAASYNQLLQNLFRERGKCFVVDMGQMSMRYVFLFLLTPAELSIVSGSGAFPRPAAVDASLITVIPANTFGFAEAGSFQPFDQGTFFPNSGLQHVG